MGNFTVLHTTTEQAGKCEQILHFQSQDALIDISSLPVIKSTWKNSIKWQLKICHERNHK